MSTPCDPAQRPGRMLLLLFVLTSLSLSYAPVVFAQEAAQDQPFTVEYYYKARWGHADEFIELYKKNHYPILERQVETGRMLRVEAVKPRYHATEEGRWDYRVTIVFRDVAAAHEAGEEEEIIRQLYPDQETFRREEQRRFEILLAHWDVPVVEVPLDR